MKKIILFLLLLQSAFAASVVVVGGGVGGLTAALYLARAGLHPIVIEGAQWGGLITQSHAVQNWPGEMEISGHELAEKMRKQAEGSGVRFYRDELVRVDFSKRPLALYTRSLDDDAQHTFRADSAILAMGSQPNHLGVPGETGPNGYWGRGVTNCAICDGNLFRDKIVGVVGGGDAAVLEALYLSNIAKQVYVLVRKGAFRGVEGKRLETLLAKPNVHVKFHTSVAEIRGDGSHVTGVVLNPKNETLPLDGVFLAIGSTPNTKLFQKALELDSRGYIALKNGQETSVAGVYAIGDIADPVYKQAISAAGDGAKAALQAQRYLEAPAVAEAEVIEVTSAEQFEQELKRGDMPIFVDFYATWCAPCRSIEPRIEKSAKQLAGRVRFLKVNVDRTGPLPSKYDVRSMPTALLFEPDGHIAERKIGTDQIAALLKELEKTQ